MDKNSRTAPSLLKGGLSPKRKLYGAVLKNASRLCAAAVGLLGAEMLVFMLINGFESLSWKVVTSSPSILKKIDGILPNILNTLYIILLSLLISLPLGVGAAIYLNEYARPGRLTAAVSFAAETLAGIPSILYGLVGMLFFCQLLGLKSSLLAGALTLAVMILPTLLRTAQEALKTVPDSYREGAMALGATRWAAVRTVVLPSCVDGILTGCILAVGRIIGESAALLFTAGSAAVLMDSLYRTLTSSAGTLSVALYVEVAERGRFDLGFAIALVLLLLAAVINLAAKAVGKKCRARR
ncbi:MAG: phosphate ABC transporter permease PstA [Oscillospiraceae bacterium]|nr:phosphate ABC transporter permease PstA [Oscillospiraceae bacterium]